jgi:hypothetical protein
VPLGHERNETKDREEQGHSTQCCETARNRPSPTCRRRVRRTFEKRAGEDEGTGRHDDQQNGEQSRTVQHLHPNMMTAPGRATLESDPDDAQ